MTTAIVTGAGSERGIGRAVALRLAAAGHAIAVLDVDAEAARRTADVVAEQRGVPVLGLGADVADREAVDEAVTRVEAELPEVAVLVNNAGITRPTRFVDIEPDEWAQVFAVNVNGTYLVTRRVLRGMLARGYGRIVNLSSVSAQRGGGVFGGTHYSAAKAALLGLTRALAREVSEGGVTVNAVAPGLIDTDITAGRIDDERMAALVAAVPVGRLGSTADVAATVAFLASPEAGYLTGTTVDVNGGSHIH